MAGPVTAAYWIRRAAALAGNEKTGNAVGTILTAFLLPFILIIVCLCGMMDAAADHNRAAVEWCFGDGAIPAAVPEEYAGHITQMRACFAVLDGAVGKLNAELEEGSVPLRANRVKADFFALNFGAPDLTLRQGQTESFAGCYVSEAVRIRTVEVPNPEYDPPEDEEELEDYDVPKTIEVEQEYMVTVPEKDMAVVYVRLHALLGTEFPEQWQANAAEIFYLAEYGADAVGGMSDGLIAGLVQDDSPEYIGGAFVSPFAGGWKNRVTSEMGGRYSPITGKWEGHRGLDIAAPKGTEIRAAANGTVLLARYGHASYGNYVVVGHGGGVTTLYAHCSALNVTVGQAVSAGDVIAFVGSTGDSTGDHLHLEVNDNGTLKNPREYLP